MSTKKTIKSDFSSVWDRIKKETSLKNMVQLAEIIETSQQNVSKRKKENHFPVEWAYKVAQKYGLLTEWIMTGNGPKNLNEIQVEETASVLKGSLFEWIKEESEKNPNFYADFTANCAAFFPDFAEWLKKRKTSLAQGSNSRQNVA